MQAGRASPKCVDRLRFIDGQRRAHLFLFSSSQRLNSQNLNNVAHCVPRELYRFGGILDRSPILISSNSCLIHLKIHLSL